MTAATTATTTRGTSVQNVDKVLNEVRQYLISDGITVTVKGVDVDKGNVDLLLEWACGVCASSTTTMMREHLEIWFGM